MEYYHSYLNGFTLSLKCDFLSKRRFRSFVITGLYVPISNIVLFYLKNKFAVRQEIWLSEPTRDEPPSARGAESFRE